ncbi:fructosamine kinase family protein [Cerasicoccus maritimus]|uniref:fructosamine kinase family protein n=1 Tax=Cerasicoccus maritimus TaxID=490089 RepID=UPI0028525975|nr:fructosamine kinase family protein [Cerasicoccus maritimus]
MPDHWQSAVEAAITEATGANFALQSTQACGGGCINEAYRVEDASGQTYFVKLNEDTASVMFSAEARALKAIAAVGAIRAPHVIAQGHTKQRAFLVLEDLDFGGAPLDWSAMGEQLAALHRKVSDRFGWPESNFIGSTPQQNAWADDWPTFFREQRLRPQFSIARRRGAPIRGDTAFLNIVDDLLAGHTPEPSLLHGDLWGGNAGHDSAGNPVIFDPASYYGDRETDLAFTHMFGGFPPSFYAAYEGAWPLPDGYERRAEIYNLYHVVNHANLFGGGYHGQAEAVIRRLLAGR